MAESNNLNKNVYSENDPLDINELASLEGEVTNDFIEQLQNQIATDANIDNDGALFEDIPSNKSKKTFNKDIDDNFIKKYKAKLQKQQAKAETVQAEHSKPKEEPIPEDNVQMPHFEQTEIEPATEIEMPHLPQAEDEAYTMPEHSAPQEDAPAEPTVDTPAPAPAPADDSINTISGGNISEHQLSPDQLTYREGLNYIDRNTKYSKYVIYIDPENKEFIDSLTVKERKNLINRIIKEQDSIALTKRKLGKMQVIIAHSIIVIITFIIAIPVIYWLINASLEATINNYRQSQSTFETLYKEHGKLKKN